MKKFTLRLLFVLFLLIQSSKFYSQNLPIIGFGDQANYRIDYFTVPGSSGLDLHWYGGIRFGDSTSNSVMQIAGGNVGIGTSSPGSKLAVRGTISSYEPLALGSTINSFQLINERSGNVGDNTIINRLWTLRDGNLNNWFNSRIHDGISIDDSFKTPNIDTRTWWERDPLDNIQSWGNAAETYFTINKGNVGIGTFSPIAKLQIDYNPSSQAGILLNNNTGAAVGSGNIQFADNGSLKWNLTTNVANDFFLYNQDGIGQGANLFIKKSNGNVGIGKTNPNNKLDVNGTVHSKEVKVDMNGWSDFVFKKEYTLPTLEQVEKQISENGHLENIPSEEEVLKNGINLGEMNAKLLQKIEELTLYAIEMKKENIEMKRQNEVMKKQNELIKEENDLIKKSQIELEKRLLKIENK